MPGVMSRPDLPQWQTDKAWAGKYLPELKRICGEHLIGEAPEAEDAHHNTDLIVLRLDAVRVACRVRQNEYLERYGGEFTIRSGRPGGTKTELTKVVEGWGDYILYAFAEANPTGRTLAAWMLGNLSVFRLWFNRQCLQNKKAPGIEKRNTDGSSTFRSFRIDDLPKDFVVKRKWPDVPASLF